MQSGVHGGSITILTSTSATSSRAETTCLLLAINCGPAGHIGHDSRPGHDHGNGGSGGGSSEAREEHPSWGGLGLARGDRVKIVGLAARPEFNGLHGVLRGMDEDRWVVELEGQGKTLKLKEANISPTN